MNQQQNAISLILTAVNSSAKEDETLLQTRTMKLNRTILLISIAWISLTSCSLEDSPTAAVRAPRNTFVDYQHIGGLVNGVWTKEHNPHIITGETYIKDGDSLVIQEGVEIVVKTTIYLDRYTRLIFDGSTNSPIRFVHNDSILGGGILGGTGLFRAKYTIFEGNGKIISVGLNSRIEKCVFSEIRLKFSHFYSDSYDSTIVRNCIFAGYRPWDSPSGGTQFSTYDTFALDSTKVQIENNLFFTGIGDSNWAMNPPAVVNALLKGQNGTTRIKGTKWPGGGNIFTNPKWVKYNYVGPAPAGISDNDYHLEPGSPAIGAGSDGTNIGVY